MFLRALGGACVAIVDMPLRSPGPSGDSRLTHSDSAVDAEMPLPPPGPSGLSGLIRWPQHQHVGARQ
eukprot:5237005-Alexandrium_andersonii.AAC.1